MREEDQVEPGVRLQPYLLDRLTRDPAEPDEETILSVERFKQSLARDLEWVFRTRRPLDAETGVDRFPLLASSSLNYGIPPFQGEAVSEIKPAQLEETFRAAILRFEPRIRPQSLKVKLPADALAARRAEGANRIELTIEGEAVGIPERLKFQALVDVAAADCTVGEKGRA